MKLRLLKQHFDISAGSEWFDLGPAMPQPGTGESRVVTALKGDTTEGCFRVVPVAKLELVKE
jgi:hypothetical protein